jgi:hypothetical protein
VSTHRMYVCPLCGWGIYHPMSYCLYCPGKLERRDVPHPGGMFETEQHIIGHLASQGVKYAGECPKVPELTTATIALARATARRESRQQLIDQRRAEGNQAEVERLERATVWMDEEIAEAKAKIAQLGVANAE